MDEHEEISYKTLRKLQQAEQSSAGFTRITANFYQDLSTYIRTIERNVEQETNKLKIKLFADEAENTRKIANSIYELREKKIVQTALATARGATPDLKNLLDMEKKLYTVLVEQIAASRKEIFEEPTERHITKQTMKQPIPEKQKAEPNTNPIVRVVEDTPEFIGTDEKTYSLRKEDVLCLPDDMAVPLLKKGVVKQVK